MNRTRISETPQAVGQKVLIKGWAQTVRDHGKITFIDVRDHTGIIQCVGVNLTKIPVESAVSLEGTIVARPEKLVNKEIVTGTIEMQIETATVLHAAHEMPFDMGQKELNLELPTLLDWRALTLKHSREQAIFRLQAAVAQGFRESAEEMECMEVFTPTVAASSTEGGAEVFKVQYYEHSAFLIQSPQLYKQITAGAFLTYIEQNLL